MRKKFKCLIIIYLLVLSILIVHWNVDSYAINIENKQENLLTSRSNKNPRNGNFDWGPIEPPSEPIFGKNKNVNNSYEPKVAVYGDKIYVIWMDNSNFSNAGVDKDIFYRHFDGNSWSDIQVISEPIKGQNINVKTCAYPDITVENGKVYVVWSDYNEMYGAGLDPDIFYRCNLTGKNWEDIQVISEPIPGQNINIGGSGSPRIDVENNRIYVVWYDNNNTNGAGTDEDIFYRCNITGNNWETIQVISEPVKGYNFNDKTSYRPEIAVENGKVYTIWMDWNDTNNAHRDDGDIFYRCNLNGNSWEPVQVISEPIPGKNLNTGTSRLPNIAVENGKIYVVWDDNNETNYAGQDSDIFYKCNLTGYSWEPIQVISEPIIGKDFNIELSWEPDIAVNSGKSHIVWLDYNDTNSAGEDADIFYRNLNLPLILSHPSVTPILGNTSTIFTYRVKYSHLNNIKPSKIALKISGVEYSMIEIDTNDLNYIDGKDYIFNIKNLDIGVNTYQFYATDGKFPWSTKSVNKPIVYNTPPIITTEDNLTAFEDIYYEDHYNCQDIDLNNVGQVGIWDFLSNAEWLTFDTSTEMLSGTPTNDDIGKYWVNISINDTIDIDFTNFTLTVINVNDAPIIITNDTETINEDELYEVEYKATDVDSFQDNLFWSMETNASWLDFKEESATLSGSPENKDVGEFWVNISVSDGEYLDFSNFTLEVINVNDPPKIITKEIPTAFEDNHYEIDFKADDIDNVQNALIWTINTNAQWLKVDDINSIINGTPLNDDVDEYWINLSVTDGEYFDYKTYTLKVENTNDPPKIIVNEKTNIKVGELYSINVEAVDIDPPPKTLIWSMKTNASDWISIGSNTGLLIGEPSENDVGFYWINVSVTDGEGGWNHYNFSLKVQKDPTQEKDTSDSIFISTSSFYGMIWIIIIIVILISIIILLTFRKQKKEIIHILEKREIEVIQTVKAELLKTTPSHIALSGETTQVLPTQPTVINQLPKPEAKALPAASEKKDVDSIKTVGTVPVPQQYQLPKETLSKEQQLKMLRERFVKGEVDLETYKELKTKIEAHTGEDITIDESEELPTIPEQQQQEVIEQPISEEVAPTGTPELVGKPPQQKPTKPEIYQPQPSMQPKAPTQPELTGQAQEQDKPAVKEQNDEE